VTSLRSPPVLADPFYYLANFLRVLGSIEEREFIAAYRALPRAAAAMLVRMIMRKGWTFRHSRLNYPEIGDTGSALRTLIDLSWDDATPSLDVSELAALLTKQELLAHVGRSGLPRGFDKPDLVVFLRAQRPESQPFLAWCPDLVPASLHSLPFHTRTHLDAFERMFCCARALAAGVAGDTVSADLPAALADNDWLEERRQALLFEIAGASERRGDAADALRLLDRCTHRGARLRRIRLYERTGDCVAAHTLCCAVEERPESAAEAQQVARVLPRLRRKLGAPACARPSITSRTVS
jgi:hypothetical protein